MLVKECWLYEFDICAYSEELLRSRCLSLTSPLLRHIQLQSFSSEYCFNRHIENTICRMQPLKVEMVLSPIEFQKRRKWNHTWYRFLHWGRVDAGRLWCHSSEYFGLWLLPPQHAALWSPSAIHVCSRWIQRHSHCCGAALRRMERHQETWGRKPPKCWEEEMRHMLKIMMILSS